MGMGKGKKGSKGSSTPPTATDLFGDGGDSEARRIGRRLTLRFIGRNKPELDRAEFRAYAPCPKATYIQQRDREYSFTWTRVPQALSLLFLEYLCAGLEGRADSFSFPGARTGSFAATLGDAMAKNSGSLHDLFTEHLKDGATAGRIQWILGGRNLHGKENNERRICVSSEYLPPDCVEVFWEGTALATSDKLRAFNTKLREAWNLEPSQQPPPPAKNEPPPKPPAPETPRQPEPPPAPESAQPKAQAQEPEPKDAETPKETPAPAAAPPEQEAPQPKPAPEAPPIPPVLPIEPHLFTVPESGGHWPDDAPLITFSEDYPPWTLGNAFEGVLILGATGSGKTSGSGTAIAETFLRAGFGGLVLTVKQKEAEHWQRLCARCGREQDLVIVGVGGDWRLNLLSYEAQRPGRGGGLCANLVSFCQNLLSVSTRSKEQGHSDPVWRLAASQLLNATFDLFLLAGGQISFDRLATFIGAAPTQVIPTHEAAWLNLPTFGEVLRAARQAAATDEDKRLLAKAEFYWFQNYPTLAPRTRTSVTLSVFAMFDAFRGRDVPALISSGTNLTPESIMAGKIVVLDLPIKQFQQTGLLVQSAWKYLFETTLEREDHDGDAARRPVFLWEEEGQHFVSDHDHNFQATARSARAARVILTQNVHGFFKELGPHGIEAAKSIFGNLNTKIFHANNDPETNDLAAKHFGSEIHMRYAFGHGAMPQPHGILDTLRQQFDPPDTSSLTGTEHLEYAVRPEAFNRLRTGGPKNNFLVDAYVTWMGMATGDERHFTLTTFEQHPR